MSVPKIKIAVGYRAGVGKDTFFGYMQRKVNNLTQISFADPIYSIMSYAQNVCGFENIKDRGFLQYIGTEWARNNDPDIWIKLALGRAENLDNVIITDVRFCNEFQTLKEDGWFMVKINRDVDNIDRFNTGSVNHSSEQELNIIHNNSWNYVIDNNGDLTEFYKKIDIMFDEYVKWSMNK